jgi:hypothetical protein
MKSLKINVDLLRHQDYFSIDEIVSPDFLNISEKELITNYPVYIKGKAYLSVDYLVINFSAKTFFQMPCRICNELILNPLQEEKGCITINLQEIKNSIYDLSEEIREALLIKLPYFVECEGLCAERKHIEKYLKSPPKHLEESYLPFQNIL